MVASAISSTTSTSEIEDSITQNGDKPTNGKVIDESYEHVALNLPKGKYTLVAVDIDTTGRRLIDEIVQLAAFTPNDHFGQYIMPYMNLNPAARQRHQVRVISIGFYRMLKSTQTYKIIKSKSEIAALKDFLNWLEAVKEKDTNSQGVILVYYEERKFIPYMILESLKKYNLLDRFLHTVKSFANGQSLAKTNLNGALQNYTLRKLSKHLKDNLTIHNTEQNNNDILKSEVNKTLSLADPHLSENKKSQKTTSVRNEPELFDGNATVRAKLAYDVVLNLSNQGSKDSLESTSAIDKMVSELQTYAQPIDRDLNELKAQNANLERQNSFRPVFLNYFKTTLYHRVRAVKFRIILAEHNYDLQTLNAIWAEKKHDGIIEIFRNIEELKSEEKTELADLFDSYFDPDKTTIKPVVKPNNNRRRNRRVRKSVTSNNGNINHTIGNEHGAGGDKQLVTSSTTDMPDSTTNSPKNQRGKRHSRPYSNKTFLKAQISNNRTYTTNQHKPITSSVTATTPATPTSPVTAATAVTKTASK